MKFLCSFAAFTELFQYLLLPLCPGWQTIGSKAIKIHYHFLRFFSIKIWVPKVLSTPTMFQGCFFKLILQLRF